MNNASFFMGGDGGDGDTAQFCFFAYRVLQQHR
jgi:hypothetical protein